jgi:hypothetical protein
LALKSATISATDTAGNSSAGAGLEQKPDGRPIAKSCRFALFSESGDLDIINLPVRYFRFRPKADTAVAWGQGISLRGWSLEEPQEEPGMEDEEPVDEAPPSES